MRTLISAALAASLFATNLLAAEINAPLAPGKAAGVKTAQDTDDTVWWIIGGAAVVAVIAVAASSGGSSSAPPTTS
jgi:hypothetical protein